MIKIILYFISVFFIGMFLGVLAHANKNNRLIKLPHKNKTTWNPGFLLDMAWGGIGAIVLVLTLANPEEWRKGIVLAIIGGYIGQTIVDSIAQKWLNKSDDEISDILDSDI